MSNEIKNGKYDDKDLGCMCWFKNNLLHREGGLPAKIDYHNGSTEWWFNGKRHNEDGPACINVLGDDEGLDFSYYIDGVEFSRDDFQHRQEKQELNLKLNNELDEKPVKRHLKI